VGTIAIKAGLVGTDAVVRTIDVQPSGRPVTTSRAGTLAAPRTLTIEGPAGSDPTTDRVRLLVFPGALALLRSELGASAARTGVADDAYALLLAARAPSLLAKLGDTPDLAALRELAIISGQRAIRHGRTLDVPTATLLTEAALAHSNHRVLANLGERASAFLAKQQRPDGTISGDGATGWTLQRVLVATAEGTHAVGSGGNADKARMQAVRAKAAGAFARNHEAVSDPYTAAAILASGAVSGELATLLRARVLAGVASAKDGSKYLAVGDGVVRADGAVPTTVEATALAVLALQGAADATLAAVRADLGATILGAYSPLTGWGDGRANLACMRAVLELFQTPIPEGVEITLAMDGTPVTSGKLDRAKLRDVLALEAPAPGSAGNHTWTVTAEPPVPGLGFSLALHSWVAWPKTRVDDGLELALAERIAARVGQPTELAVTAVAPPGIAGHVVQALPAGVQVDTPSLEALVVAGTITRFQVSDGKVELFLPPLAPGQTFTARYRVVPTIAGELTTRASSITAGANQVFVPPTAWTVQ
ncbi:MAG TPA: hypothetical protein VK427_09250, partial [Kofleriaceae bacterium]|nr:hypothetical protein [Kofleriaceae bacterium]